jgi:hypothetical protein
MSSTRAKKFNREINRDDLCSSRLTHSISLRKTYVDDFLFKKRFISEKENIENEKFILKSDESRENKNEWDSELQIYREVLAKKISPDEINSYAKFVFSSDKIEFLTGIVCVRKILSLRTNPPVENVVKYGIAERVITQFEFFIKEATQNEDQAQGINYAKAVIHESLWILTNISSVKGYDLFLYQQNILYLLIEIFTKINCKEVISQATWLVANLAGGENKIINSKMIELNYLSILLKILKNKDYDEENNCLWAISNIVRSLYSSSEYFPSSKIIQEIKEIVYYSCNIIQNFRIYIPCYVSTKISDSLPMIAVHILKSLTDKFKCVIEEYLIEDNPCTNIVSHLIQILKSSYLNKNPYSFLQILCLIGNYSISHRGTSQILSSGFLDILHQILKLKINNEILSETCFILSNIIAGSNENVELFFKQEELLETVIELALSSSAKTKREAIWCLCSLCDNSDINNPQNLKNLKKLLNLGYFEILAEGLSMKDSKLTQICLEALEIIYKIKKYGSDEEISQKIHYESVKVDLKYILEILTSSENSRISEKSIDLISIHFSDEYQYKLQEDYQGFLDHYSCIYNIVSFCNNFPKN